MSHRLIRNARRCCPLLALLGPALAGCAGPSPASAGRESVPPTVVVTQTSRPVTPTPFIATPVPASRDSSPHVAVGVVMATDDEAVWRPRDPYSDPPQAEIENPPFAVSNAAGTLTVVVPPFNDKDPMQPQALGDYTLRWTPAGDAGPPRTLLTLPGRVPSPDPGERADPLDEQYIAGIAAFGDEHFLMTTYTTCCGAQTGNLTRIWWIEPASGTANVVAEGRAGGGSFLTTARNERWLFWNMFSLGETATITNARAFLIDARTGNAIAVDLGGDNATQHAWWQDGLLLFESLDGSRHRLDPDTLQVAPLP